MSDQLNEQGSNKAGIGCLTIIVLVGIIGGVSSLFGSSKEPADKTSEKQQQESSKPMPYGVTINDEQAAQALIIQNCDGLRLQLFLFSMASGKQSIQIAQAMGNAYAAARFVSSTQVVSDWESQFSAKLNSIYLEPLSGLTDATIADVPKEFVVEAARQCDLSDELQKATLSVQQADEDAINVVSFANAVPWYPEGFQLLSDGVAGRWIDKIRCSGFAEACWGLEVTTENGCPNDLYVELTILDANDFNIGFTNDTTGPLRYGEKARMLFDSYDYGAHKARVAEASCY